MAFQWGCKPAEVLERFDSDELTEWQAADRLGLLPDSRLEAAQICATINNLLGSRAKSPADFLPQPPADKSKLGGSDAANKAAMAALRSRLVAKKQTQMQRV